MRTALRTSLHIAIVALSLAACSTDGMSTSGDPSDPGSNPGNGGDDDTTPPADTGVTGTWVGNFTTDNSIAGAGDFNFVLSEDGSHAVTGPFTGTVTNGASGTAFKGMFTGSRAGTTLTGTVSVTEPAGVTGSFDFGTATITSDMIAGDFDIDVAYSGIPVQGNGSYTITRM